MKKIYSILFAALAVSMSYGQAFTGTYNFASVVNNTSGLTDPTPVPTVTGMVFGSFSATNPVATQPGANGRFVFDNQPLGAGNGATYASLTGSVSPTTFYEVTLSPQSGYSVDLTSITFTSQRSNTGVRTYVVRSSADGYVANLPASISPANANLIAQPGDIFFFNADNNSSQTGSTITLSGVDFTGLTSPITFRFYAYNAEASTGNFSIDDVVVSGNINTLSAADNNIEGLKMYPNPVSGNTLFLTSRNNLNMSVQIFDLLGKEVLKSEVTNNSVNVSTLNSGVYVVKITEEGKTATRKLVIE